MNKRLPALGVMAAVSLAAVSLAVGCGSTPPPTERMTTATTNVRVARELGAEDVPRARLHLRLAERQLDRAAKLIDDDKNERADWVLQRASADAELAVSLAREAAAREALDEQGGVEETMP